MASRQFQRRQSDQDHDRKLQNQRPMCQWTCRHKHCNNGDKFSQRLMFDHLSLEPIYTPDECYSLVKDIVNHQLRASISLLNDRIKNPPARYHSHSHSNDASSLKKSRGIRRAHFRGTLICNVKAPNGAPNKAKKLSDELNRFTRDLKWLMTEHPSLLWKDINTMVRRCQKIIFRDPTKFETHREQRHLKNRVRLKKFIAGELLNFAK